MSTPTVVSRQKLADKYLFSECHKQNSLPTLLTQQPETMISAYDGKKQTSPNAPVVQINDLSATAKGNHGTSVSCTIIHELSELGQTGIANRDGFEEDISTAAQEIQIDQQHKSDKVSLMIEQQAVGYDRKALLRPLLVNYKTKFDDECFLYHIMGARGTYTDGNRLLPLASNPKFAPAMVNPIMPPTFNRMGYCGNAGSIDGTTGTAITAADVFTAADVRKFKEKIELMSHPLKPVNMAADMKHQGTDPMYVAFITPKMWTSYESASTDFQNQIAQALRRTTGFNHPLFRGDMFMKDNILFKKYLKPVGWQTGKDIAVSNDDDSATTTDQTVPASVTVERGFILGGQALCFAHGSVLPGTPGNFKFDGEMIQKNAWYTAWIDWIAGMTKTRFADRNGRLEDYGVFCFDGAV